MRSLLQKLLELSERKIQEGEKLQLRYPKLWLAENSSNYKEEGTEIIMNPYYLTYYHARNILERSEPDKDYTKSLSKVYGNSHDKGEWLKKGIMVSMFLRVASAWDHDGDGILGGNEKDITLNSQGIRETGTFIKSIYLLPYLKKLGVNIVYIKPVSLSGRAYKKGELPSPYSVRNPFKLEPLLGDPLFEELSLEEQFLAFVEAVHRLGMRLMIDFVPRTASRDSDWIPVHPNWFYWIYKEYEEVYGPPKFTEQELKKIHEAVEKGDFYHLIPPSKEYIKMFAEPPKPEKIKYLGESEGYVGYTEDGREVIVAGAFADWPPDDIQPPWTDVTYLRYYMDKDFNYIAYNTVRMYDAKLEEKNIELWKVIEDILPFYQANYGLDGARIDMGHALPKELSQTIINRSRTYDPDFAFLSEDFNPNVDAYEHGYNAVIGNSWWVLPRIRVKVNGVEKSFFKEFFINLPNNKNTCVGAVETPDTPRSAYRFGHTKFSKLSWLFISFAPNTIPFISLGFEIGEKHPLNLGLDFTPEEIKMFSKQPLGFFDRLALNWKDADLTLLEFIKKVSSLRQKYLDTILRKDNYYILRGKNRNVDLSDVKSNVFGYIRIDADKKLLFVVIGNLNFDEKEEAEIDLTDYRNYIKDQKLMDLLSNKVMEVGDDYILRVVLEGGEVLLLSNVQTQV